MAITFESYDEVYGTSVTSIDIPAPSGIIVNDFLFAHLSYKQDPGTVTPPSGWTLIADEFLTNTGGAIYYKIAVTADTTAIDYTFSTSATPDSSVGVISRWSGVDAADPINAFSSNNSNDLQDADLTTGTITPDAATEIILAACVMDSRNVRDDWAIVTDNPSWTSEYKYRPTSNTAALGHGSRPETTATGEASTTIDVMRIWAFFMVALNQSSPNIINGCFCDNESEHNGRPVFTSGTSYVFWSGTVWALAESVTDTTSQWLYYSDEDVETPHNLGNQWYVGTLGTATAGYVDVDCPSSSSSVSSVS
jgi:hypothetical protein